MPEKAAGLDGWVYVGCSNDTKQTGRTLLGASTESSSMSWEVCQTFCNDRGYRFAGVEYYRECYCDNYIMNNPQWNQTHCEAPCTGAKNEMCGDAGKIMIFRKTDPGYVPPMVQVQPTVGKYAHKGCYVDDVSDRALSQYSFSSQDMTPAKCTKACLGRQYKYSGVEFG